MSTFANIITAVLPKLARLAIVLFVVTVFTFLLVRLLPGDPVDILLPIRTDTGDPTIEARRAEITSDLGLDESLPSQYATWLGGFVTGDLGSEYSVSSSTPVSEKITAAIPPSLQLIIYSQILALLIAIPAGVISAYRQNGIFDKVANAGAFGSLSLPNFAIGLLLAYWVGVRLSPSLPDAFQISPQGYSEFPGFNPFSWTYDSVTDHVSAMILPTIALSLGQIAVYMRLLRSDMIQTLQEDFILMAKSKGISDQRVLWRHALRPSTLTLLTVAGLSVGTLIGGTVVIEVIFGIPGMGRLINESVLARQFVTLQSCVAIVAIFFVLINAVLDILYSALDPRIRNVRAS